MKKNVYILSILALGMSIWSCKKDNDPVAKGDVRDSVYAISQEAYLWNDKLPSAATFKPTGYAKPEDVMEKIRTFSPLGTNGKNVDRWSFAIEKKIWDDVSAGVSGDFGAEFALISTTDLRIANVYKNSSAGQQGVQRGWQVLTVNGVQGTQANVNALNTELGKNSIAVNFKKPDGSQQAITLTRGQYVQNSVITRSIITQGGKKIGYIAFNSFLGKDTTPPEVDEAFAYFKANNVTELIFDERYNGGGYVFIAEQIANLVVPSATAGKLMYTDFYNPLLTEQAKRQNLVLTENYSKPLPANNLNLKQIVFITTEETASASELLINVLKPYMTVKIVGQTTYGKPVGYSARPAMDYYAFPVMVKQNNASGYGDYYAGFTPDRLQADDVTKNWGDASELCTSDALSYLVNDKFPTSGGRQSSAAYRHLRTAEPLKVTIVDSPVLPSLPR